ncbi:uncharacterized protein (TIGR03083 family) [Tamaricihabitans halophyticus]|uniref:Uncharacterized protein (TIGR03083 family) n=1 Tax=Tamaricihabitans halophyticus TaxID=1262583 RepID=A0A4R2QST1_9PSEU|nr:maleylpyruvate isomerase family mycothiol-dependent enzyme [Tamaricihabitans halophyticus]TCP52962.1 uncharacterized protein (TIGR03083 family) [Tamaricihabitans halophyticus]
MEHRQFLGAIREHCAGLRAAAIAAGPGAPVPTCPRWTVSRLVQHLARVQDWVVGAVEYPAGPVPEAATAPGEWGELLDWWDDRLARMLDALAEPTNPAWFPFASYAPTAAGWARRQAHEAAIHRLDAEHAARGSAEPGEAPAILVGPEFALDGVEELLGFLLPDTADWSGSTASGSVLVHATDAGKAWLVRLIAGQPLELDRLAGGPAAHPDATVAGSADAIYRALWGRPSTALRSGNTALLNAMSAP